MGRLNGRLREGGGVGSKRWLHLGKPRDQLPGDAKLFGRGKNSRPGIGGSTGIDEPARDASRVADPLERGRQRSGKALAKVRPDFDPGGTVTCARYGIYILTHRYEEALHLMQQSPQQSFHMEIPVDLPKALLIGQALRLLHKDAEARAAYEEARGILEASVREVPDDAMRHALLGQIYAALGRKEDAIREGKRAVEILPESKDALEGPMTTIGLAQIYAVVGDRDGALSLLEHLLEIPSSLSVQMLRLDPIWDSLRNDPRFIALLKKYGGSS